MSVQISAETPDGRSVEVEVPVRVIRTSEGAYPGGAHPTLVALDEATARVRAAIEAGEPAPARPALTRGT